MVTHNLQTCTMHVWGHSEGMCVCIH